MTMERLFSGLLGLLCLLMIYLATGYTAPIAYDPLGPRPYPTLVFALLAFCLFVVALRPKKFAKVIELGYSIAIIKNLILCVIALLAYSLLFESLGFPIATMLMSIALGYLFAGNILKSLIFSIGISIGLFVLFDVLLDVKLPLGLLSGLMR